MLKPLIRPVIAYGAEAWALNTGTTRRLAVFERKVLRKIVGAVKMTPGGEEIIQN